MNRIDEISNELYEDLISDDDGDENHLLDINITFEPIPPNDFDDLEEGMDIYSKEKCLTAWINDADRIIEEIYPEYENLTWHTTEYDEDENYCTIQCTTRADWMNNASEGNEDTDFCEELIKFLEKKYQGIKVDVEFCTYHME